jgi:hypothetical protein
VYDGAPVEGEGFKHLTTRSQRGGSRRTPQMLRIQRLHPVGGLRIKQPPTLPAPDLRSGVWQSGVWQSGVLASRAKKSPRPLGCRRRGLTLATIYFHMACRHTIIDAEVFHFRVRDGNGWGHLAVVTRLLFRSGSF